MKKQSKRQALVGTTGLANNRVADAPTAGFGHISRPAIEPIAISLSNAAAAIDSSTKTVTRLVAAGKLDAVKLGTKTLILVDSLKRYVGGLPAATFASKRAA